MMSISSSRQVKSVRTAFRIVHLLQNRDAATQTELAEELDMAKSTLHNYLGTLETLGYVVNRDGKYTLGLRFLTHGMAAKSDLDARDVVDVALGDFARKVSLPAWWIVEELGRGIFVERAVPGDEQAVYGRLGKRSYLHTTALGKAILARLPPEYLERVVDHHGLPVHTTETITDVDELADELERIRAQGYAISTGEAALGVQSIGKAFEDRYGSVHAIGVFGYSHDFGGVNVEDDVASELETAVEDLQRRLDAKGERA